jgi:L-Ala-D/L-Glu epimerase / N-acetyl-D-glutamate racemase
MHVVELKAWHVRIPLKKPIRHASHTRTDTDNVVIRCTLADGAQGFGEGVPREYVTGETIESALRLLKESDLPHQLPDCPDFGDAVRVAEKLHLAEIPGDVRHCQGNSARCAVELALLDAYGKHFGQPLSAVTPLVAPELHEPKKWVRYSGAITSADGWKAKMAALKMRVYGFRALKVKVGIEGQNDVKRLMAIRRRVGPRMDLRIDANEAWMPNNVVQRIVELKPFRIASVEQPVPHADVASLSHVRAETGVPIMLDESLCGMVDAERAAAEKTCNYFNLRISKCGGFLPTLRLAQFAGRHGIGCQLGCQVGETAILSAAGRHFAASVRGLRWLEGSYDRHLVKEALGTRDLTFGWGGRAQALVGPGLGVEIDPAALERVKVRQEVLLG